MNVIVSNRQKEIIDNANIDAIKDLNGLFNVDDLINKFKNYFFSKMILDATSVINFASRDVLSKLASEIGGDKLVILLPSSPEPPLEFRRLLVDLGIFNFSNNINDVVKYLNTPNTYENAMNSIMNSFNGSGFYVDNSIKDNSMNNVGAMQNDNGNSMMNVQGNAVNNLNGTAPNNFNSNMNIFNQNNNVNNNQMNGFIANNQNSNNMASENNINNGQNVNSNLLGNYLNSMNISDAQNDSNINREKPINNLYGNLNNNSTYEDVVDNSQNNNTVNNTSQNLESLYYNEQDRTAGKLIIGVRNVTEHAGSTTLVYLLRKLAEVKLKKNACAFEINKNDFKFYHDEKMISVDENLIFNAIKSVDSEYVFVDLNNCKDISFCRDVIYLLEPSIIKLNKLMAESKYVFKSLLDKKVILNKSLLSSSDIKALSNEAGINIFYNLEPLNDRVSNNSVIKLLSLLGIK